MSVFHCNRCDNFIDTDFDAECGPDPDDERDLICGPCLEDELSDMTTRERYGYRAETEWFGPAKLEGDR